MHKKIPSLGPSDLDDSLDDDHFDGSDVILLELGGDSSIDDSDTGFELDIIDGDTGITETIRNSVESAVNTHMNAHEANNSAETHSSLKVILNNLNLAKLLNIAGDNHDHSVYRILVEMDNALLNGMLLRNPYIPNDVLEKLVNSGLDKEINESTKFKMLIHSNGESKLFIDSTREILAMFDDAVKLKIIPTISHVLIINILSEDSSEKVKKLAIARKKQLKEATILIKYPGYLDIIPYDPNYLFLLAQDKSSNADILYKIYTLAIKNTKKDIRNLSVNDREYDILISITSNPNSLNNVLGPICFAGPINPECQFALHMNSVNNTGASDELLKYLSEHSPYKKVRDIAKSNTI